MTGWFHQLAMLRSDRCTSICVVDDVFLVGLFRVSTWGAPQNSYLGMDQYLYIPFLGGWTSIYQLFWGSLGARVLTHPHLIQSNTWWWTIGFWGSLFETWRHACLWTKKRASRCIGMMSFVGPNSKPSSYSTNQLDIYILYIYYIYIIYIYILYILYKMQCIYLYIY